MKRISNKRLAELEQEQRSLDLPSLTEQRLIRAFNELGAQPIAPSETQSQ